MFLYGTGAAERPEHFFPGAANRAFPIIGKILEMCSFGDLAFAIASVRVINIATAHRLTLIHLFGGCHVLFLWLIKGARVQGMARIFIILFVPLNLFPITMD
jgi:hypothetical protein